MSRKLKLPKPEVDPKCNTSIRASTRTTAYVDAIRTHIHLHMQEHPDQMPACGLTGVNNDHVIALICRVFARDYGVTLPEIEA